MSKTQQTYRPTTAAASSPEQSTIPSSSAKKSVKFSGGRTGPNCSKSAQLSNNFFSKRPQEFNDVQKKNRFKYNSVTSFTNSSLKNYKEEVQKKLQSDFLSFKMNENELLQKKLKNKLEQGQNTPKGIHQSSQMAEYKFEKVDYFEQDNNVSIDYEEFKQQYVIDEHGNYLYRIYDRVKLPQNSLVQQNQIKTNNFQYEDNKKHLIKAKKKLEGGIAQSMIQKAKQQSTINPRNQAIIQIRQKSLNVLDEKMKLKKVKQVVEECKQEVLKVEVEMNKEIDKLLREIAVLKKELQVKNDKVVELQNDNDNQKMKNHIFSQEFDKINLKFDNLKYDSGKLECFVPEYKKLVAYFEGYQSEKIISEFENMQKTCVQLQNKLSEMEADIIRKDKQQKQKVENLNDKFQELQVRDEKRERSTNMFIGQLKSQEQEYQNANVYKLNYIQLFNKVIYLYNEWHKQIKVYPLLNEDGGPIAHLKDPLEILDQMEKMVKISSNPQLQAYLRKIIVSANLLQRRFMKESVNNKFDPDKIYEGIMHQIKKVSEENFSLKAEIKDLKTKISKFGKIQQNANCSWNLSNFANNLISSMQKRGSIIERKGSQCKDNFLENGDTKMGQSTLKHSKSQYNNNNTNEQEKQISFLQKTKQNMDISKSQNTVFLQD